MRKGQTALGRIRLYGLLHAVFNIFYLSGAGFAEGFETVAIADSLARNGSFSNPYAAHLTGMTAHAAPVYPAFLSVCLALTQARYGEALLASLASCIAFICTLVLLPCLADSLFGEKKIGIWAAWVAIALPVMPIEPQYESTMVAALSAAICAYSLHRLPGLTVCALTGLTILLSPSVLLFMTVWFSGHLLIRRFSPRSVAKVAAAVILFCLPWVVRNYLAIGTLSIRDNFGLELQVYNNDLATASFNDSGSARATFHPNESLSEAEKVKCVGELEYNRQKLTSALSWIRSHPTRFISLTVSRFVLFWLPDPRNVPFAPVIWILTLLSIPAMLASFRFRWNSESILVLSLISYSLPYALVAAEIRYRVPVLWITLLFAMKGIKIALKAHLRLRLGNRQRQNSHLAADGVIPHD